MCYSVQTTLENSTPNPNTGQTIHHGITVPLQLPFCNPASTDRRIPYTLSSVPVRMVFRLVRSIMRGHQLTPWPQAGEFPRGHVRFYSVADRPLCAMGCPNSDCMRPLEHHGIREFAPRLRDRIEWQCVMLCRRTKKSVKTVSKPRSDGKILRV